MANRNGFLLLLVPDPQEWFDCIATLAPHLVTIRYANGATRGAEPWGGRQRGKGDRAGLDFGELTGPRMAPFKSHIGSQSNGAKGTYTIILEPAHRRRSIARAAAAGSA